MLMANYTSKLLDLEDVIITNVENIAEVFHSKSSVEGKKKLAD